MPQFEIYDEQSDSLVLRDDCPSCECVSGGEACTHGCWPYVHYATYRMDYQAIKYRMAARAERPSATDEQLHDESSSLSSASLPLPITESRAVTNE